MDIQKCIDQVTMFNEIAGNLSNVTYENLIAQAKVVFEEGNELFGAVIDKDPNEILKECVDCLVVVHGFAKMLEEQGYNVLGAWSEVNKNNLSKFPTDEEDIVSSLEWYGNEGFDVICEYNDTFNAHVLKDSDGKVRKPLSYKKCSVASYTPKGVLPKKGV